MNSLKSLIPLLFIFALACNSSTNNGNVSKKNKISSNNFHVSISNKKKSYQLNDSLYVVFSKKGIYDIDSILVSIGDGEIQTFQEQSKFGIKLKNLRVGLQRLKIQVFSDNGISKRYLSLKILSDIEPVNLNYKIIKKYKHNPKYYTQGLVYEDGYLYEGTGQPYESILRRSNLSTNKNILERNLKGRMFGEGIALTDKYVFQLTWQSKTAFKYNKSDLSLVSEYRYNSEGWGLTTVNGNLLMSDGTAYLREISPSDFTVRNEFLVADNNGFIKMLNELEYVEGFIFSNIYLKSYILKIDYNSGKVVAKLDLSALVPDKFVGDNDNVLNGIAFIPERNTFLVTGKRWDTMYEISIF